MLNTKQFHDAEKSALSGAIAGLIATVPMTAFMLAAFRALPRKEQYPLPPHQITGKIAARLGHAEVVDEPEHYLLTAINHFGYGAATGAGYGPLADMSEAPPAAKGVMYGLMVWSASYLGWLPAAKILRPATQHPVRRTALMVAAHVIWGATLGVAHDKIERVLN